MLPLWDLADILRHKPIREISKRVLSVRYSNEPIAMGGVRKPSLHFYTKQIITYESYSDIGLVNLSDRLRFEVSEKWSINNNSYKDVPNTVLIVIDRKTSSYPYWKNIKKIDISSYGIYNIWRVNRKDLEEQERLLVLKGTKPNWQEIKKEKY